jgi:hypothetical protein
MKGKRIFAWAGIIVLVGLYVLTLVSACIQHPLATQLFYASLFATVVVPIFIYVVQMITKYLSQKGEDEMK